MSKRVQFNSNVSQTVFDKTEAVECGNEFTELLPLTDEHEVVSRMSEFQNIHRFQKRQLHEHHIRKRKLSRLHMRDDISELFWTTFEAEVWKRLTELAGDSVIISEHVDAFALEAITSVDKNEII